MVWVVKNLVILFTLLPCCTSYTYYQPSFLWRCGALNTWIRTKVAFYRANAALAQSKAALENSASAMLESASASKAARQYADRLNSSSLYKTEVTTYANNAQDAAKAAEDAYNSAAKLHMFLEQDVSKVMTLKYEVEVDCRSANYEAYDNEQYSVPDRKRRAQKHIDNAMNNANEAKRYAVLAYLKLFDVLSYSTRAGMLRNNSYDAMNKARIKTELG
ncbi:hypothetical protein TRVL_07105 [Trypanosoma vivax]|uniref:Trypanosoma glutamic acid/alanine-rich protein domain-containing protein n=1 Tax=Trypanosoma vivax (strain Y486) TaxID=1055687 RepID=G0TV27_TRYVY|nr:hypothetical protein TRVL_07105 [Trypanosoma vivax]CCC47792.1 hypothetical protein, unlikely [Trypanosoma vivax Y486]